MTIEDQIRDEKLQYDIIRVAAKISAFSLRNIDNKNIIANIFRIQAYDSVMCGHFCIGFINFMFNGNSLTDFTNLFSSNNVRKMMI